MERNVVSLETAKSLKAAGFPQDTNTFWWKWHPGYDDRPEVFNCNDEWPGSAWDTTEAWTAQEIADQLPALHTNYVDDANSCLLIIAKQESGSWYAGYQKNAGGEWSVFAPTMAEALAALWLKLHQSPELLDASKEEK